MSLIWELTFRQRYCQSLTLSINQIYIKNLYIFHQLISYSFPRTIPDSRAPYANVKISLRAINLPNKLLIYSWILMIWHIGCLVTVFSAMGLTEKLLPKIFQILYFLQTSCFLQFLHNLRLNYLELQFKLMSKHQTQHANKAYLIVQSHSLNKRQMLFLSVLE